MELAHHCQCPFTGCLAISHRTGPIAGGGHDAALCRRHPGEASPQKLRSEAEKCRRRLGRITPTVSVVTVYALQSGHGALAHRNHRARRTPGEDRARQCDHMTTNDELERLYKDILNDTHAMEAACVKTEDELRALNSEELASRLSKSAADLQTQRLYLLDYAKTA